MANTPDQGGGEAPERPESPPKDTAPAPPPEATPPRDGGKGPGVPEIGGPQGPEPTRYGDWERNGRVSDF